LEGEGRNAVFLAGHGHRVTAVDGSAVGLEKAKALAAEQGVTIEAVVTDLSDYIIPPDSFDSIISIFCHVPRDIRGPLHRRVVDGLKPGGVLILEAYRPAQLKMGTGGPPVEGLMMTLPDLHQELEGLEFLMAQETEREIREGRAHTGQGAVVQVIARKPFA
jgi:SAM-dependent methyltransferase